MPTVNGYKKTKRVVLELLSFLHLNISTLFMFFIAFIIGKRYNLDKFNHLIKEGFPMRKTVTGILLATSVLAMATVQQVQAAESGATSALTTSTVKEVHYVAFQNGRLVDIKAALTGSAVTDASIKDQPKIENYKYTTSEEMDGILYHTYAPADTTAAPISTFLFDRTLSNLLPPFTTTSGFSTAVSIISSVIFLTSFSLYDVLYTRFYNLFF